MKWSVVFKKAVGKMDTSDVLTLGLEIAKGINEIEHERIRGKNEMQELKEKGKIFLEAIRVHEDTFREFLRNHHEQSMATLNIVGKQIEIIDDIETKKELCKWLVEFSKDSIEALRMQQEKAMIGLPNPQLNSRNNAS